MNSLKLMVTSVVCALAMQISAGNLSTLHYALKIGDEVSVRLLLEGGIDANLMDNSYTPLGRLASCRNRPGSERLAQLLLEHGAKVEVPSGYRRETPLHSAVHNGAKEVIRVLLEWGADINSTINRFGQTPLHRAADKGRVAIAGLLIANGADRSSIDSANKTPWAQASSAFRLSFMPFMEAYVEAIREWSNHLQSEFNLPRDIAYNCVLPCVIPAWQAEQLREGATPPTGLRRARSRGRLESRRGGLKKRRR